MTMPDYLAKLTKKQRGFVKDYVETENGTQSALKNYDVNNAGTASAIAVENLQKPLITEAIIEVKKSIAERLPDEFLLEVHLDGLSADNKGEPDYAVRHKYLDTAYKLKGSFAPEKGIQLNVDMNVKDLTPDILREAQRIIHERTRTTDDTEPIGDNTERVGNQESD